MQKSSEDRLRRLTLAKGAFLVNPAAIFAAADGGNWQLQLCGDWLNKCTMLDSKVVVKIAEGADLVDVFNDLRELADSIEREIFRAAVMAEWPYEHVVQRHIGPSRPKAKAPQPSLIKGGRLLP